jgi:hypothetical protein
MGKIRFKVAAMALLTAALTFTGTPIAQAQCQGDSQDDCPYGSYDRGYCAPC